MDAERLARLERLADRQDILDCLTRFSRGMDRFDRELFLSAFHPDATIAAGVFVRTWGAVVAAACPERHFPQLAPMIDFHELSTPLSQASFVVADRGAMYGLEMSAERMSHSALLRHIAQSAS
jgi:hypothetical protein